MSYTNSTPNLHLPQYIANDKPTYLGDWNATMQTIDTVMTDTQATANGANSTAISANSIANTALNSANNALSKAEENSTAISQITNNSNYRNVPASNASTGQFGLLDFFANNYTTIFHGAGSYANKTEFTTNSVVNGNFTYIPFFSINENIYKLPVTNISSDAPSINSVFGTLNYTDTQNNVVTYSQGFSVIYNGAQTIFYIRIYTSDLNSFSTDNTIRIGINSSYPII